MMSWQKIKPKRLRKDKAAPDAGATKQPVPAQTPDEDLYESGDICAPEPDRDDEQRDL